MDADRINKRYPHPAHSPVLISEVTRMSGIIRCVAGFDTRAQKMVRPLQAASSNWPLGDNRSVFEVGHLVDVTPTGARGKTFPHATEDTPLSRMPKVLERFDEATTYGLLIGTCVGSFTEAFGVKLIDNQYVAVGTRCPSLVGISVPRKNLTFHTGYGEKLRLRVTDSDNETYDLGVTSDRLLGLFNKARDSSAPFGVNEANPWLSENGPSQRLILRVGLARPFDGKKGWDPLRCYLQLNGIVCPEDHYHVLPYDEVD